MKFNKRILKEEFDDNRVDQVFETILEWLKRHKIEKIDWDFIYDSIVNGVFGKGAELTEEESQAAIMATDAHYEFLVDTEEDRKNSIIEDFEKNYNPISTQKTVEVEDKAKEVMDPVMADAQKQMKKTGELRKKHTEDAIKACKDKSGPKELDPERTEESKRMHLSEALDDYLEPEKVELGFSFNTFVDPDLLEETNEDELKELFEATMEAGLVKDEIISMTFLGGYTYIRFTEDSQFEDGYYQLVAGRLFGPLDSDEAEKEIFLTEAKKKPERSTYDLIDDLNYIVYANALGDSDYYISKKNARNLDKAVEALEAHKIPYIKKESRGRTFIMFNEAPLIEKIIDPKAKSKLLFKEELSEPELTEHSIKTILNNLIIDEQQAIQQYEDALVNIEYEDIKKVLEHIIEEESNHIGMLQKCFDELSLIDSTENIDSGREEAEELLNISVEEPAIEEVVEE